MMIVSALLYNISPSSFCLLQKKDLCMCELIELIDPLVNL